MFNKEIKNSGVISMRSSFMKRKPSVEEKLQEILQKRTVSDSSLSDSLFKEGVTVPKEVVDDD